MQAKGIFEHRHYDDTQCNSLAQQLQQYLVGDPPYDQAVPPDATATAWWLNLAANSTAAVHELRELATLMCHMVPHAASYERIASLLGWYCTPVRSQLDLDTLAKVVAVKSDLQQQVPRCVWERLHAVTLWKVSAMSAPILVK